MPGSARSKATVSIDPGAFHELYGLAKYWSKAKAFEESK